MKSQLQSLLAATLAQLAESELAGVALPAEIPVERTRDAAHGDFASNIALALSKSAGRKPRELAEIIVRALPASRLVKKVEIAGPGFINFFLDPTAQFAVLDQILEQGEGFGRAPAGSGEKILIEYVSANPTGPLHVGHGRGAAYGDSLANLLEAAGHRVTREYYINDAGRQVEVLTLSVWLRYLEQCGETLPAFPQGGYPGEYIRQCARHLHEQHGAGFRRPAAEILANIQAEPVAADQAAEEDKERIEAGQEAYIEALIARARALLGADYERIQRHALDDQLAVIRATLNAFGAHFDGWYSERELVGSGKVTQAIARLRERGQVYEQDDALWLRSSAYGDEKDRVLFKADGAATYFANDLAYHVDKLDRGFAKLLDVWGADHHGYVARVRAAVEILTGHKEVLQVQFVQFVTLSSGRMGKRSGNFVTFSDLLQEAGRDATRFFYLLRSHDQHLEFDLELARAQTNDNPVFYVQYAHARLCRVMEQLAQKGWTYERAAGDLTRLTETHEQALLTLLARYPEVIAQAAAQYGPHILVHYLRELADAFHSYYNAHTFLVENAPLRNARLSLCLSVRQVIRNALGLVGVSAPERM